MKTGIMMKSFSGLLACGLSFAGCDAINGSKSDPAGPVSLLAPTGTGCVQGVVINGLTGDRVEMTRFDGENGIFVMVRDQLVGASNVGLDGFAKESMAGQYSVCGIPTDEDYPLFVHINEYQPFEGVIHIESTATPKSPNIETHLVKSSPAMEANIVVYPKGTKTQDLHFFVYYNGSGVKDATVQLRPTGRNVFEDVERSAGSTERSSGSTERSSDDKDANYNRLLNPRDVRLKSLTATTGENGEAIFAKDSLVLGGVYRYVVLPPDNMTYVNTKLDSVGTVIVGLQTDNSARDPYRYYETLSPKAEALKELQTSIESQSNTPDGSLIVLFNRPVEIVSNPDAVSARLTNAVDAELMPEIANNQTSETTTVTLSADGTSVKFMPRFKTVPNSSREPALQITYSGLQVRPASAPLNAKILPVEAKTVKLFGYDSNPTLLATTISAVDSTTVEGTPGQEVGRPLSVKVKDQFGLGLRNQSVSFIVTSGGGTVKRLTDGTYTSSVTVTTDADGVASVNWALGTASGNQSLEAKVAGLGTVTFQFKN